MCTHCTRRHFLGASAVSAIAVATGHLAAGANASTSVSATDSKVRICAIIAG